jgi:hypothetical protein
MSEEFYFPPILSVPEPQLVRVPANLILSDVYKGNFTYLAGNLSFVPRTAVFRGWVTLECKNFRSFVAIAVGTLAIPIPGRDRVLPAPSPDGPMLIHCTVWGGKNLGFNAMGTPPGGKPFHFRPQQKVTIHFD